MEWIFIIGGIVWLLNGAVPTKVTEQLTGEPKYMPQPAENKLQKEFDSIPPPSGKKISVAVYQFTDKTGQRKSQQNVASFSYNCNYGRGEIIPTFTTVFARALRAR